MPVESVSTSSDAAPAGLPRIVLVLGGARSGKSRFAENLIAQASAKALYIATAERRDPEMIARIAAHRARRGAAWTTLEEPLELVNRLLELPPDSPPVLVDCLTLWLANLMEADRDIGFETERLCSALAQMKQPVVLVANEVGLGIVPDNALARAFRDHAGRLNQSVAALAERVVFLAAGLPMTLKG
ncbi:MAG TPA: bifunctional adenosylcobinamide kinase/adenosylcobinamide-phosphate guanylyltransferase [Stellaceae bacterium]|nr:bifunctional adenosylcobinamide kinase/adenosylcobinamide-phosphate guanylyltransferase [Stellaceae bacterium]